MMKNKHQCFLLMCCKENEMLPAQAVVSCSFIARSCSRRCHFLHSAFKVYSAAEECGRTVRAVSNCLQSASRLDDENDVMQTVRRCGLPKYTLALILICACVKCGAEVK